MAETTLFSGDLLNVFVSYILGHIFELGVVFAIVFGFYYLYRMLQKIPKLPDYIKIFEEKAIEEQKLNKPDRTFGAKFLYRGDVYLGKIVSFDEQKHKVVVEERKGTIPEKFEEKDMISLAFKSVLFDFKIFAIHGFKKKIVKVLREEVNFEGLHKLILPSNLGLTNLGNEFVSKSCYQFISKTIVDDWNRRLLEASTNANANQMLKIAGYVTEFAQERRLKELEIEKLKAEKSLKMGSII